MLYSHIQLGHYSITSMTYHCMHALISASTIRNSMELMYCVHHTLLLRTSLLMIPAYLTSKVRYAFQGQPVVVNLNCSR